MFVVSVCDDFHQRLLLFSESNLFLRANKETTHPEGTLELCIQSERPHFRRRSRCYL